MNPPPSRADFDDARSVVGQTDFRVARRCVNPHRVDCGLGRVFHGARRDLAQSRRDHMPEFDRIRAAGGEFLGDRSHVRLSLGRDGLDRELGAVDVLLDEHSAMPREFVGPLVRANDRVGGGLSPSAVIPFLPLLTAGLMIVFAPNSRTATAPRQHS